MLEIFLPILVLGLPKKKSLTKKFMIPIEFKLPWKLSCVFLTQRRQKEEKYIGKWGISDLTQIFFK